MSGQIPNDVEMRVTSMLAQCQDLPPFDPKTELDPDFVYDPDLLERADAALNLIRNESTPEVDRFELLAAVVWPTEAMLEAQRTRGAGLTSR